MLSVVIYSHDQLMIRAVTRVMEDKGKCRIQNVVSDLASLHQVCQENLPSLLFMDINEEPIAEIATICEAYPLLPVYVTSFCDDFATIQGLIRVGIKSYLLKPLSISDLSKIIVRTQSRGRSHLFTDYLEDLIQQKRFDLVKERIEDLSEELYQAYRREPAKTLYEMELFLQDIFATIALKQSRKLAKYKEEFVFTEAVLGDRYALGFHLFEVVDMIFRELNLQKSPSLKRFYDYINDHIDENILLNEIADLCGLSQSYLSRLIKDRYQIGFNTYLQYRKIEMAKKLFYFQDQKIIDVAFQLGYSESSYFCKVFKKIEGITPMKLKKEMAIERAKRKLLRS